MVCFAAVGAKKKKKKRGRRVENTATAPYGFVAAPTDTAAFVDADAYTCTRCGGQFGGHQACLRGKKNEANIAMYRHTCVGRVANPSAAVVICLSLDLARLR